jgi:hypothetical protein
MIKRLTTIALLSSCTLTYGQNTFPTNGNVGIGTPYPEHPLHLWEWQESRPGGVNAATKTILKFSRSGTGEFAHHEGAEFKIGHGGPGIYGSKLDLFIDGPENTIGPSDRHAMTWQYNGNVGIGTTTPQSLLHLQETEESKPGGTNSATKTILKFSRSGTPGHSYNESAEFRMGHGGPSAFGSKLDLFIAGPDNAGLAPDMHSMTWQYNGNVGIGTEVPKALLDVGKPSNNGALTTALSRQIEGNGDGDGTFLGTRAWETQVSSYSGKAFSLEHGFYGSTNSSINFYRGGGWTGGHIRFATNNGTEQMIIDAYGKVGIGTMTPTEGYRLTVAGKITGAELKIQQVSGWADYVFLPSYQLRSLTEVEAHIKEKGYLPEVPSASEIQKNEGYELGKMDATLLKKIEELTLYAIKMEKEIKNLQSESASLKEENSRLKNNILSRLEQLEKQPVKGN